MKIKADLRSYLAELEALLVVQPLENLEKSELEAMIPGRGERKTAERLFWILFCLNEKKITLMLSF